MIISREQMYDSVVYRVDWAGCEYFAELDGREIGRSNCLAGAADEAADWIERVYRNEFIYPGEEEFGPYVKSGPN